MTEAAGERVADAAETAGPADAEKPGTARKRRGPTPTRILLASAAIGAAGGLIVAPVMVVASGGPALAFPVIYSILLSVKLIPGLLAQMLLRRPGVALLTGIIVGLINIPFSAHGAAAALSLAAIGLVQEIPAAIGLYRRWSPWLLGAGSVVIALVLAWLGWRVISVEAAVDWMRIAYWPSAVVAAVAVTWISAVIARGVRRTGALGALDEKSAARA